MNCCAGPRRCRACARSRAFSPRLLAWRRARGLTTVSNNAGNGEIDIATLLKVDMVTPTRLVGVKRVPIDLATFECTASAALNCSLWWPSLFSDARRENTMLPGRTPPPVSRLLGARLTALDMAAGTLGAEYEAPDAFLNPAGQVQGGMLCAMLDDLCAVVVLACVDAGQGVATLNLNVSFLRPALQGYLQGRSIIVRGGKSIYHVEAVLEQAGVEVARASACCKISGVRMG